MIGPGFAEAVGSMLVVRILVALAVVFALGVFVGWLIGG